MEIKNRMWMNGSLEWFAFLGEDEVFLGQREVPYPLSEGDSWINAYGDRFEVIDIPHCSCPADGPSSGTRPAGRVDCNQSAMAGFAAAHG